MFSRASTKKYKGRNRTLSLNRAPNNINTFLHPKRPVSRKATSHPETRNRNEIFSTRVSIGSHPNNHKKAGFFTRMYEKYREYMVHRADKRYHARKAKQAKNIVEFEKRLAELASSE